MKHTLLGDEAWQARMRRARLRRSRRHASWLPAKVEARFGRNAWRFSAVAVLAGLLLTGAGTLALRAASDVLAEGGAVIDPATDYRLAPLDRVRVRVLEWRVTGYYEWEAINGEYVVDSVGAISLPLIGRVNAMEQTTAQLSGSISRRLQQRADLKQIPEAAVEIVQYRPIYIVGDVQNPGEYAYRPGLTTLKGLAVAGGVYRLNGTPDGMQRSLNSLSRFEQANLTLRRMYARKARLAAQKSAVESGRPAKLQPDKAEAGTLVGADMERLLNDERQIMQAELGALNARIDHQEGLIELYGKEKLTLKQQIATQMQQVKLARENAEDTEKLFRKRLTSTVRRMNARTTVAQIEGQLLDYESALLRVSQQLNSAEREITEARAQLLARITTDQRETEASIETLKSTLSTERALLDLSGAPALGVQLASEVAAAPRFRYVIRRVGSAGTAPQSIEADDNTPLRPGDVIEVRAPQPSVQHGMTGEAAALHDAFDQVTRVQEVRFKPLGHRQGDGE